MIYAELILKGYDGTQATDDYILYVGAVDQRLFWQWYEVFNIDHLLMSHVWVEDWWDDLSSADLRLSYSYSLKHGQRLRSGMWAGIWQDQQHEDMLGQWQRWVRAGLQRREDDDRE